MFDFIVNNFVWLMVALSITIAAMTINVGFFQSHPWHERIHRWLTGIMLALVVTVIASYSYVKHTAIESIRSVYEQLQDDAPRR